MKEGSDIALIAALIGDPARANILTALMAGKALTARNWPPRPASRARLRVRIWRNCARAAS